MPDGVVRQPAPLAAHRKVHVCLNGNKVTAFRQLYLALDIFGSKVELRVVVVAGIGARLDQLVDLALPAGVERYVERIRGPGTIEISAVHMDFSDLPNFSGRNLEVIRGFTVIEIVFRFEVLRD